jgi:hypothetical protein
LKRPRFSFGYFKLVYMELIKVQLAYSGKKKKSGLKTWAHAHLRATETRKVDVLTSGDGGKEKGQRESWKPTMSEPEEEVQSRRQRGEGRAEQEGGRLGGSDGNRA